MWGELQRYRKSTTKNNKSISRDKGRCWVNVKETESLRQKKPKDKGFREMWGKRHWNRKSTKKRTKADLGIKGNVG